MKERISLLAALAAVLAGILSLGIGLLESQRMANTETLKDSSWLWALVVYASISIGLGVYATQIARVFRRLLRRRRVVITHTRDSEDYISKLSRELRKYKIHTWSDLNDPDPGDDIVAALPDQIRDSDGLLILPKKALSKYDDWVVQLAQSAGIRVIPIVSREDDNKLSAEYISIFTDEPIEKAASRIASAIVRGPPKRHNDADPLPTSVGERKEN